LLLLLLLLLKLCSEILLVRWSRFDPWNTDRVFIVTAVAVATVTLLFQFSLPLAFSGFWFTWLVEC
jgi:hypothetical protein